MNMFLRYAVPYLQAVAIKAIAGKIMDKYYIAPHAEAQAWERRTAENRHKDAEARGLPTQKLPGSMPSMEFRKVWSGKKDESGTIITVWHPIGPPGYKALGDVISLGVDAPSSPVQVGYSCILMYVVVSSIFQHGLEAFESAHIRGCRSC